MEPVRNTVKLESVVFLFGHLLSSDNVPMIL